MASRPTWKCFMDAKRFHKAVCIEHKTNTFDASVRSVNFKIASLDLSPSRVGVAISDGDRHFALPLGVFRVAMRDGKASLLRPSPLLLEKLQMEEKNIAGWVVGWPLLLNGGSGNRTTETLRMASSLEGLLGIKYKNVLLHDERYSTVLARADALERPDGMTVGLDALAAARILQEYLDLVAASSDIPSYY